MEPTPAKSRKTRHALRTLIYVASGLFCFVSAFFTKALDAYARGTNLLPLESLLIIGIGLSVYGLRRLKADEPHRSHRRYKRHQWGFWLLTIVVVGMAVLAVTMLVFFLAFADYERHMGRQDIW